MKSNEAKFPNRKSALQTAGRRWNPMKRSLLRAGLRAVLCVLFASSALAEFSTSRGPYWPGITDHYSGNTWISNSVTFNNSGSLIYSTSTFPTNTGPLPLSDYWMTGDYWWAADVFVRGSDGVTVNNTGTIQSIVSGYGSAQAVGILSLQSGLVITNWGTIDGQVQNHDGEADGVWTDSQSTTIINNGTISARSKFVGRAINTQNSVRVVNNGTIQAIADAGTDGVTANRAKAHCFGVGGSFPMYFENNGQIKCITTSTTATNESQLFTCWNNGPILFKNTGLLYSENSSPNGHSQTAYFGAQSYDLVLYNSGTITNAASDHNGLTMWYENDGDRGNMVLNNSGTITSPGSSLLFLTGHWGPPGYLHTYYTNSGTFSGGQMRFYGIPATIYEAGQIHATLFGLSDASDVHVMGLPTIDPTLECGGNNSTLEFNLIGTLQQVNGSSVSGTNLSAFSLGQSGNIVVSGKTYRWSGAGSGVSGIVNPAGCVPAPWQQQDIGAVGVAGGAVYCGGMFTVLGSGNNIGGAADAFHFVYQTASNNCSIIAPLSVPQTATTNAQASVMIRDSLNANAANVFVGVTGINTVTFQYRSSDGGTTSSSSVAVTNTMYWVKLAQNGSTFTGYYSVDGTNWTQVGTTTIGMAAANCMGLAFCSKNNSSNGMGTFYSVTCTGTVLVPSTPVGLTATAGVEQVTLNWQASSNTASYNIGRSTVSGGPYTIVGSTSGTNYTDRDLAGRTTYYYVVIAVTPGSQSGNSAQVSATPSANVPAPWVAQDLGPVGAVGSESYTNGVFTVSGSGADIDNSQSYNVGVLDTCRFVYATNSGNCAIVARVTSVQNIDPESKGGVMIRNGLNSDEANVFVGMTPGTGVVMSYRSTNSANGTLVNNVTNLTVPYWVALVQTGTSFSGYYSTDGNNWTLAGTTTVSMTGTEYLGLTVSSRDNTRLCTATFDNVSAPGWPSVAGPTGLTVAATPGGQVNLTWNALTNAASYNVKRSTASGGPYSTIASGVTATNFTDLAAYAIAKCYYVVSAVVGGSETANSTEVALLHPKLTGTIIGTPGSWNNSGNTIAKVFDNNLNTYFDAPDPGNGDWVGLYFGASVSNAIVQINYCPRSGFEGRMVGGIFQGANQSDFSDAVALFTVTTQPSSGRFTSAGITNMSAFRYVRYLAPDSSWGNVAELEFYGYLAGASVPLPAAPGGLAAAAVSSSQINLTWDTVTNVIGYNVKRSMTNGGFYTVVVTGVTATHYLDTGLAADTAYFYVVSGTSTGGEGGDSAQVSATTPLAAPLGLTAAPVSASQINLSWNAVAGATSYNVKRSRVSGGPYTTIATDVSMTSYADTVAIGMKYYYVVSAVRSSQEGSNSLEATVNLPYPWVSQDVGAVGVAGSAAYSNGVFTVGGSGWDIQDTADAFRFVYVPVAGSCTIIARITSVQNINPWSKAGVMIRESTNANAANAFIAVTPGNGVTWQSRSSTGGGTGYNNTGGLSAPYWVKLVRSGTTFMGYRSPDGTNWTQQGSATISMASTVYIGMALTSHNSSSLCTATFDNVTAPGWPLSPGTPGSLTATAGNAQVTLTWPAVSGASSYNLKSATNNGGPYSVLTNVTTTNYTNTGLLNDTTYYYVVSALNIAGESTNGVQASATPQAPPTLNISQSGPDLAVSWPPVSGFSLQSCTNLALGNWVDVTSPAPQIVGSNWQVALPQATNGSAFYRLSK
jgi:fibronectin type 3 domain-containing protein/regulation of enolase protein 1 (concanavalin A-like superfamily)